ASAVGFYDEVLEIPADRLQRHAQAGERLAQVFPTLIEFGIEEHCIRRIIQLCADKQSAARIEQELRNRGIGEQAFRGAVRFDLEGSIGVARLIDDQQGPLTAPKTND